MHNTDTIKPLWVEGIVLGQQHFQALDHNLRERENLVRRNIHYNHWGVMYVGINKEQLLVGKFQLDNLLAILPNGSVISVTDSLNLDIVFGTKQYVDIYLTWEGSDYAVGAAGYPGGDESRWLVTYKDTKDIFDREKIKEVAYLNMKLNLSLEKTSSGLHLARIKGEDLISYKLEDYIVPMVQIGKDFSILNKFKNIIYTKIIELQELHTKICNMPRKIDLNLNITMVLAELHLALLKINALLLESRSHPKDVFDVLLDLFSKLYSFKGKTDLDTSLVYSHSELNDTFMLLHDRLIDVIDVQFDVSNYLLIEQEDNKYQIDLSKFDFINDSLVLGFSSKLGDLDIDKLQSQCKIADAKLIDDLIKMSLPGIKLELLRDLPNGVIPKHNYSYFKLVQAGEYWDKLVISKHLSIYMAGNFSDVELDVMAIEL